jgi:dihydrofolate reductase
MTRVFFDVGMSLDGFVAGPNGGPKNPLGDGGTTIHQWMFKQRAFLQLLKLGDGGDADNPDNDLIEETFNRTGAYIMGRRMFDEGEPNWPEDAPFRSPVFVVTHQRRDPWERKGGTTFFFTSATIQDTLQKATQAARNKDVRISGGADIIQQYLNAGLVDEFTIHVAPLMLRNGVRLFKRLGEGTINIEGVGAMHSPLVVHLKYRVVK